VPLYSDGWSEDGSSGSALLNSNNRIIATMSGNAVGSCDVPVEAHYGRFNTAYLNSRDIRNALNPNNEYSLGGIDGRGINCYENLLNLNGDYYPAEDYQQANQIVLSANNDLSTNGELIIHEGAEFTFEAGNSIEIGSDFTVETGAIFEVNTGINCNSSLKSSEEGTKQYISSIPIPDYKEFEY